MMRLEDRDRTGRSWSLNRFIHGCTLPSPSQNIFDDTDLNKGKIRQEDDMKKYIVPVIVSRTRASFATSLYASTFWEDATETLNSGAGMTRVFFFATQE